MAAGKHPAISEAERQRQLSGDVAGGIFIGFAHIGQHGMTVIDQRCRVIGGRGFSKDHSRQHV